MSTSGTARLPGCDIEVSASQAGSSSINLQSGNALGAHSCSINLQCGKAGRPWPAPIAPKLAFVPINRKSRRHCLHGCSHEGYVAIKHGRKFVGTELKEAYFRQAVRNLTLAEDTGTTGDLVSMMVA